MRAITSRRGVVLLAPLIFIAGCVSLHAPLTEDEGYPSSWAPIVPLGPECTKMTGDYENAGTLAVTATNVVPVLLTNVLDLPEPMVRLSLKVATRKIDKNGDAFSKLTVISSGDTAPQRDFEECFCIKQSLMCKVSESYRGVPYIHAGGSQRNVYFSIAEDGALVARLQDYHIDVVGPVPVFGKTEPWARFPHSGR